MANLKHHQILAKEGAYEILHFVYDRRECNTSEIFEAFSNDYSYEQIDEVIRSLESIFFLERMGESLRITEDGSEGFLLLKVINGASLDSIIDQLTVTTRRRWSLITRDITGAFFRMLSDVTNIKAVLICSPWIRLNDPQLNLLFDLQQKNRAKVSVITRSVSLLKKDDNASWRNAVMSTLIWLVKNGVEIVQHPNLHAKLYIIESSSYSSAIFGSENLTSAGNIELGIEITDESIIKRLISYWEDTFSQSKPLVVDELIE